MKKHYVDLAVERLEKHRTEVHNLACKLTEEEVVGYAKEAAKAHSDIDSLQDQKKRAMDQYKNQIGTKESEIKELNRKISTGLEHRDIDCEVFFDFQAGEKYLVRSDTGDVVEVHPISEFERQRKLKLEKEDEPSEEEKAEGSNGPEEPEKAEEASQDEAKDD